MNCEQCPYIQTLDADVLESNSCILFAQELDAASVVADAEITVLDQVISDLPDSPQKYKLQQGLAHAIELSSELDVAINWGIRRELTTIDKLNKLSSLATSRCMDGPRVKRKLFGDQKIVCQSQSPVVDDGFKR